MQGFSRVLALILIPILVLLSTGCDGGTGANNSALPPRLTPCVINRSDPNLQDPIVFYHIPPNFNNFIALMTNPPLNAEGISDPKEEAWSLLVYEVMKWSVQHDVPIDEVIYRFTVTLISPELITAIIMAEYQNHGKSYSDALAELKQWIEKREQEPQQILFLLTINSSNQGTLLGPNKEAIRIPINNMALRTMSGLSTSQPQGEGIFAYDLDPYDAPIQYYFYFPISVLVDDMCTQLLLPERDLTFTLGINSVKINGVDAGDLSWEFELARLINVGRENDPLPQNAYRVNAKTVLVQNLSSIPICNMPTPVTKISVPPQSNLAGDINYWLPFSLCVWETISGTP